MTATDFYTPAADTVYRLWDDTNNCLLGEWEIRDSSDMEKMKNDLLIMGVSI